MKIPGALIMVLAVAIAVVPLVFNCTAEGRMLTLADGRQVSMKCFYTAMAEIAVAVSLLGVGGMMTLSSRKETRRVLGVMGGVLGAFAVLFPTAIIGVCANRAHECNMVMLPTLLFAGTLVIALSLGTLVVSERRAEAVARA